MWVQRLYRAGARRFVVAGVGSMGCIPSILERSAAGRCSEEVDALVVPFNDGVRAMLDGLNAGQLPGASFTYLDNYRLFKLILADPPSYGKIQIQVYLSLSYIDQFSLKSHVQIHMTWMLVFCCMHA